METASVNRRGRGRARLAIVVAVVLAGCMFAAAPPVRYFEVRAPREEPHAGAMLPSVIVPNFSCLAAYDHLRVVLRRSDVEVVTSRRLQWTTVPGRMMAQAVRVHLKATTRFESVRRRARPEPPYAVEGQVQVIELSKSPTMGARLGMHINVRRTSDGGVIEELFIDESTTADGSGSGRRCPGAPSSCSVRILHDLDERVIQAIENDVRAGGRRIMMRVERSCPSVL